MANLLSYFIPRDRKFFPLFQQAASNLVQLALVNYEMSRLNNNERVKEFLFQIETLEHKGDQITHEIFKELGSNFITPFDREDIHALASAIDDICDHIHGAAKRMDLYKIEKSTVPIQKLSEIIYKSAEELNIAIIELQKKGNLNKVMESCVKITGLENHADDVFEMAIAQLFEEEKDPIKIIKMKEVLSTLETATDKCEDAANVLESIILKHN